MILDPRELFGELERVPSPLGPQYHDAPFYTELLSCVACPIRAEASKVVPGIGPQSADILFLGRNPGRDEDSEGRPFIGRGGGELDRMLDCIGIDRQKVAILNTCKCHTMGDRPPRPMEIEICTSKWLQQELTFFHNVSIIFPLGKEATQVFLGPHAESVGKREGYWVKIQSGERVYNVCPLNHPGYILRLGVKQQQMYTVTLPRVKKYMMENLREAYDRART